MAKLLKGPGSLLLSVALAVPVAHGQQAPAAGAAPPAGEAPPAEEPVEAAVDVEVPGGEIVVLGRRDRNLQKGATEVIAVLSSEDIARTGEGDVAGALGRVTGLSLVGGGFVYVRGLGDRYSLALLNGSPLPSPEPLRRAVPLDLFPTDVIASSLVQKTYSPNFTGEFGGGLINLTTLAVPPEPFLNFSVGTSGDTETTGQLGYTHYGSKTDWLGYDSGVRNLPSGLKAFFASGETLSSGNVDSGQIARQFINVNNGLVQKNPELPANFSISATGGTSLPAGESDIGVIATVGFSNKWRTREITEQSPANFDLSAVDKDYRNVETNNRVVLNALLGLGGEFGDGGKLRWTNFYVRDTLKRTSLAEGERNNQRLGADFIEQNTGWYERELVTTQLNGGYDFGDVQLNGRVAYAQSGRKAPFELALGYVRTNQPASQFGPYFVNRLDNGQQGFGRIAFSDLNEDLWSAGLDLSVEPKAGVVLSAGYEFGDTRRESQRREFQIIAPSSFPSVVGMFRPDYLVGGAVIDYYDIGLIETTESDPAFAASLRTDAAYLQVKAELLDGLEINGGARWEKAEQFVRPVEVFTRPTNSGASTRLENDYVLPALTVTYKFLDTMQLRFNASQTIARPQFRELMFQSYYDPESNRAYRGNPLLVDSEFVNAEARYEWYYARDQRFSAAGFYKEIDRPIEAFTGFNDNTPVTSFANAPRATLYGVELELQRYFPLDGFSGEFFGSRRAVVIGNYTWTQSRIEVGAGDTTEVFGTTTQPASNFFTDGAPLTGQSDHLVNLQLGLEDEGSLSQQTILLSYASDRVTSRGAAGLPDIYESPGLTVDFVARQGLSLFGQDMEFKFEARNLLGTDYEEFQERGSNRVYYNRYELGRSFSVSLSVKF